MEERADSISRLINALKRLPGIGGKTARRLTYYILSTDRETADELADAVKEIRDKIKPCSVCGNFTESDPCAYCSDETRDHSTICVVEHPSDLAAIEGTQEFKGVYHVLKGVLSPIKGIGPGELAVDSLLKRIRNNTVKEVITATNPTVEGETTALYLSSILKPLGVKVSRIAMGMPAGSDIEFADGITIASAIQGRREL